jgi:hypothetical protein
MNLVRGKIFGFAPCIPISSKTGLSFLPNRLKAARDCQTSITRQPPGIGPAICASTPLTGQSASLFLRPFNIILTLFSYLARDVAPRNSKRTPMGMGYLPVPVILKAYQWQYSSSTPESGHVRCTRPCPLRAISGHHGAAGITVLSQFEYTPHHWHACTANLGRGYPASTFIGTCHEPARSPHFDALTDRLCKAQVCLGMQVRE